MIVGSKTNRLYTALDELMSLLYQLSMAFDALMTCTIYVLSSCQPFLLTGFCLHFFGKQIVGGIWADKIGGKLVLGFGVVWWSIATVLTPIAAKIGLPFLLIMRAFMGIGEVGLFLCFFVDL